MQTRCLEASTSSRCVVQRRLAPRRCVIARAAVRHVVAGGKVYLDPVQDEATAFAPATIANLGPGFDWLGCAVEVRFRCAGEQQQQQQQQHDLCQHPMPAHTVAVNTYVRQLIQWCKL
jgi:hypothetical protein